MVEHGSQTSSRCEAGVIRPPNYRANGGGHPLGLEEIWVKGDAHWLGYLTSRVRMGPHIYSAGRSRFHVWEGAYVYPPSKFWPRRPVSTGRPNIWTVLKVQVGTTSTFIANFSHRSHNFKWVPWSAYPANSHGDSSSTRSAGLPPGWPGQSLELILSSCPPLSLDLPPLMSTVSVLKPLVEKHGSTAPCGCYTFCVQSCAK